MSQFDIGPFVIGTREAWQEFRRHKKIGLFLSGSGYTGIVVRIVNREAETLELKTLGKAPSAGWRTLYDDSYAACARLLSHPEYQQSFDGRIPPSGNESAAIRVGRRVLSCAGMTSELSSLLLLKAVAMSHPRLKSWARARTLDFPKAARAHIPDDLLID